jgi:hypothetical protein
MDETERNPGSSVRWMRWATFSSHPDPAAFFTGAVSFRWILRFGQPGADVIVHLQLGPVDGKREREGTPLFEDAPDGYIAGVKPDDLARDGESQAGALVGRIGQCSELLEFTEYLRQVLLRDAAPRVGHGADRLSVRCLDRHADRAGSCEFDRIADQVVQNLGDAVPVREHTHGLRGGAHFERQTLAGRDGLEGLHRGLDNFGQLAVLLRHADPSGLDLGDVEDRVDDSPEMIRVPDAHGEEFNLLFGNGPQNSVAHQRHRLTDGRERGAELVRYVADEVVLQAVEDGALGDVPDGHETRGPPLPRDVHGPDFPFARLPVAADNGDLDGRPRPVRMVERPADQFSGRLAEKGGRRGIEEADDAVLVDHQQAVAAVLDDDFEILMIRHGLRHAFPRLRRARRSVRGRQNQSRRSALAGPAFVLEVTLVRLDDAVADRQAEPGAVLFRREEGVEHPGHIGF